MSRSAQQTKAWLAYGGLLVLLGVLTLACSDGQLSDGERDSFRRRCGDGVCQHNENCTSCPTDCGRCSATDAGLPPDAGVDAPTGLGLSFEAEVGKIGTPFYVSSGAVVQDATTMALDSTSGRATYDFVVPADGQYVLIAQVSAPSTGANSFFVNIDAEPQAPTMIWDVPVTSGFERRAVSWRGNAADENDQFAPKIFALKKGLHQLVLRGREGGTRVDRFTFVEMGGNLCKLVVWGVLTATQLAACKGLDATVVADASRADAGVRPPDAAQPDTRAPDGPAVACGDQICQAGETCSSCPADCGACPTGLIAESRRIDWSKAGVEGGIPSASWTQCGATVAAGSSVATVQAAINSCGTNQYVRLGAGTFTLSTGLVLKSNMALRGMGADQTFLVFTGTNSCAGGWAAVCFAGGDSSDWSGSSKTQPGGPNAADWSGGYAKGTNQITLTNIGSSGVKVGQYLYLDQAEDTAPNNGLFVCESTSANPPCSIEGGKANPGRVIGGIARQQVQIVKVTGCSPACQNGAKFTIEPSIHAPNHASGKSPGAYWASQVIHHAGLEDLSLDASNSGGLSNVSFYNAVNVWVRGTRQVRTCTCNRDMIQITQSARVTIKDNYFYGTSGHSQNYGVEAYVASDSLILNNIFQHVVAPMMLNGNTGNVYAYNYVINATYDDGRTPIYHWMSSAAGLHSGGVLYNLLEGNVGPAIAGDSFHGNQLMNTLFRNRLLGSDPGRIDNQVAVTASAWNRYWNVIGNVLGTPGVTTVYSGGNTAVYNLGGGNTVTAVKVPDDPLVASTMMRWGNFDTVTAAAHGGNGARFDAADVPSAIGLYSNPVPATQSLPASLYYASKPAWWPAGKAWPPIGPDVSGGNIAGLGGHAHTIPAQDCFATTMGGPADGGGSVRSFNASTCYGTPTP